ncbi:MAG: LptA/OstA family protein [Thermodesulfobacteriota bacterium]|nr:LptA/OstA family protein [Thermodesulfobacteriota bacterium]
MKNLLSAVVLTAVCLGLWPSVAHAQGTGLTSTKITSDKMHYDPSGKQVIFTGKVRVEHTDFLLFADTITVFFPRTPNQGHADADLLATDPGKIEKIIARGNVRIEREGKTGQCKKAVYLVRQGLLTMEGNPVLQDGKNKISGKTVKFYLKDNRSEVEGGKDQRVEALFFSPKGGGSGEDLKGIMKQ